MVRGALVVHELPLQGFLLIGDPGSSADGGALGLSLILGLGEEQAGVHIYGQIFKNPGGAGTGVMALFFV